MVDTDNIFHVADRTGYICIHIHLYMLQNLDLQNSHIVPANLHQWQ